jgi:hypothetical protein
MLTVLSQALATAFKKANLNQHTRERRRYLAGAHNASWGLGPCICLCNHPASRGLVVTATIMVFSSRSLIPRSKKWNGYGKSWPNVLTAESAVARRKSSSSVALTLMSPKVDRTLGLEARRN